MLRHAHDLRWKSSAVEPLHAAAEDLFMHFSGAWQGGTVAPHLL